MAILPYIIAIAVLGLSFGIIFVIYFFIVRSRTDQHRSDIQNRFNLANDIVLQANAHCSGQTSHASGIALHGGGILFLTHDSLHFEMSIPSVAWHIPLKSIKQITTSAKTLHVTYTSKHGHEKNIAWQVPNLKRWYEALRASTTTQQSQ